MRGDIGEGFVHGKRGGGSEGLAPGTAVAELRSQRRIGKPAWAFRFSTKQVFHSGAAFTLGPVLLPAHMTSPSGLSVSGFYTLVATRI